MAATLQTLTSQVPLSLKAHHTAKKIAVACHKKQAYLNLLAIYAVDVFLNTQNIATDTAQGDSHNPALLKLIDFPELVADLCLENGDRLECRPVLPGDSHLAIPPETQASRLVYLGVQLDDSLRRATILGFIEAATVRENRVPLSALRSLDELPSLLNRSQTRSVTNLAAWLSGTLDAGWNAPESLWGAQTPAWATRRDTGRRGAKLLDLDMALNCQRVVLFVALVPVEGNRLSVRIQVRPDLQATQLPPELALALVSQGKVLRSVRSRDADSLIQLPRFQVSPGEGFQVRVSLGEVELVEEFVIR